MSIPAIASSPAASLPDNPASKPDEQPKITRKVRDAISAMVWLGLKREEAAQRAGMKDNSLYVALRRPDVKAAYLAECEVLRVSGRARRIHRLEQMSEQDENKAAVVNAIRALELMGSDEAASSSRSALPGLQIVIVQGGTDTRLTQALDVDADMRVISK